MKIVIQGDCFKAPAASRGTGMVLGHRETLLVQPEATLTEIYGIFRDLGHWDRVEAPLIVEVDGDPTHIEWGNNWLARQRGTALTTDTIQAALEKSRQKN